MTMTRTGAVRNGAVRTGAIGLAAAVLLTACGGGGVSESKLESKLKNESQIKTLEQQAGSKKDVVDKIVTCIAKAMKKDADQDDLKKYVDGKMNLEDIGGKGKGSEKAAANDAKNCATNVVKTGASPSA